MLPAGVPEGTALVLLALACAFIIFSELARRRLLAQLAQVRGQQEGPLGGPEGHPEGYPGEDPDERLRELSARARHLAEIIRAEPECVKTLDADARLLEMNPAGIHLIEADSLESVQGACVLSLVHPDWREAFEEMHRAVISGESRTLVFRLVTLKGTSLWMETHAAPFVKDDGCVLHLAITRDITGSRKREQDLIEAREVAESASRAKSEFLANMSHELRTPLTAILGYSELLDDPGRSQDDLNDGLATIRTSGRHLLGLISDILDMTKIEASQFQLESVPFNVSTLVTTVMETQRFQAKSAGIELNVTVPERAVLVHADPMSVRQVLINLVGNAIKFTSEGSVQVSLASAPCDSGVQISLEVCDTGIGMDGATMERIFAPFAQADSSTKRRFGGTGLGLAISRRLAELLGGTLTVESEVGVGSTFRMDVELEEATAKELESAETAERPKVQQDSKPLAGRVLLVDDLAVNRRVFGKMLARLGVETHVAEDGLSGMHKALKGTPEGNPFDVVLMDMHMPVMDGFEAATRLRDARFSGQVIALTADAMSEDRERCLAAGCSDYLSKPVSLATLRAMLGRHLQGQEHDCPARSA